MLLKRITSTIALRLQIMQRSANCFAASAIHRQNFGSNHDLWKIINEIKIFDEIPLKIYASNRSKLNVAFADVPGPIVHGIISLVTETNTNDGLPHTLEHLVFTGCHHHPYSFDLLANRCLAAGSNAWTDQDHTAYTLSTVGNKGFLKAFPTYMRYILSPTLTDSQFLTEVHHINGDGHNGGVVYCEMQDVESDFTSIIDRKRRELMYPEGCPYRVETGGRLENLRFCTIEKVRQFHKHFYHLNNLLIIICGIVDSSAILKALSNVESEMMQHIPNTFSKPFQNKYPPIDGNREAVIKYPSDDEDNGTVQISWFIADEIDLYRASALDNLIEYLGSTVASPLERDFIQLTDSFAGTVDFSFVERPQSELLLQFGNVPIAKLPLIKDRLFSKTIVEHCDGNNFNMERMKVIINDNIRDCISQLESSIVDTVSHSLIFHQLYGNTGEELDARLNSPVVLKKLLNEPPNFWANLVKRYLNTSCVCIIGYPSIEEANIAAEKETKRIEKQREDLGESGLLECDKKLQQAVYVNSVNEPTCTELTHFTVNDLDNFELFRINTFRDHSFFGNTPFMYYLHECSSKFIRLYLIWDTIDISFETRVWLEVFTRLVFTSSAMVDDKIIPYDELTNWRQKDLSNYGFDYGISSNNKRYLVLMLEALEEDHINLQKWVQIIFKELFFDDERIKILLKTLIAENDSLKFEGDVVCHSLIDNIFYKKDSNHRLTSPLILNNFYKEVLNHFSEDNSLIIEKLKKARSCLLNAPLNIHIDCSENFLDEAEKLKDLQQIHNISVNRDGKISFQDTPAIFQNTNSLSKQKLLAMGCIDSSFMYQVIGFNHNWRMDEYMSVLLFAEYLSQDEGILWREIRSKGLAYNARITLNLDSQIRFLLYRSSQIVTAYEAAKNATLLALENDICEEKFESAKRSLICQIIEKEDTLFKATRQRIYNLLHGRNDSFVRELCNHIWYAKSDEVKHRAVPYFHALFNEKQCSRAIVVPISKLNEVKEHFIGAEVITMDDLFQKYTFNDGFVF